MSINIQIDVPFLPLEEYAARTGQTVKAVRGQVDEGHLPVKQFSERGKRYVNMVALYREASKEEF